MAAKELQKMNRLELLEVLMQQAARIETLESQISASQLQLQTLEQELRQARKQLESRELRLQECGNIAEAALALSGIFESAQKAADLYLDYVTRMERSG